MSNCDLDKICAGSDAGVEMPLDILAGRADNKSPLIINRFFSSMGPGSPNDFNNATANVVVAAPCGGPPYSSTVPTLSSQDFIEHPGAAISTAVDPRLLKSATVRSWRLAATVT